MSEERFDRIDKKLEELVSHFGTLDSRVEHLGSRMDHLDSRMDHLDSRMNHLDSQLGQLATRMDSRFDELDRHMHVLHEEAVSKIKAVAEYAVILDEKMDRGFAEVKEAIGREIDPVKAAIHDHTARIERLEKGRSR